MSADYLEASPANTCLDSSSRASRCDVFLAHRNHLLALARRITQSDADAEDVTQDAWIRWSRVADMEVGEPKAWLGTVTMRLAIDCVRKRHSSRVLAIDSGADTCDGEALISIEPPPDASLDTRWATHCLYSVLTWSERAAFVLHDLCEIDYRTLGGMIERQVPACRQMVHRARGRLTHSAQRVGTPGRANARQLAFVAALQAMDAPALLRLVLGDM